MTLTPILTPLCYSPYVNFEWQCAMSCHRICSNILTLHYVTVRLNSCSVDVNSVFPNWKIELTSEPKKTSVIPFKYMPKISFRFDNVDIVIFYKQSTNAKPFTILWTTIRILLCNYHSHQSERYTMFTSLGCRCVGCQANKYSRNTTIAMAIASE